MKLLHYLYIAPLAALLSACNSNEELSATDHPNGTIELKAGIVEGGSAVTRAGAEDSHNPITETETSPGYGGHQTLTTGTQLALRVSGTWTGHSPSPVVQTTTATVGTETVTDPHSKHNNVNFTAAETLYWDDYGTADPDNAATGRAEGLTIFGAAVNGKTVLPTELNSIADWTMLSWTLSADQTTTDNTPADKDLLISNNVQAAPGASISNDGTYKFDERTNGKLLEFRHALSKITVYLKAGYGFEDDETTDLADIQKFSAVPEVLLTGDEGTATTNAWAYKGGTVNITTGTVTKTASTNDVIKMCTSGTAPSGYQVAKEALVIPGSAFASDDAIIARINADGNIYYVTAKEIRDAIDTKFGTTTGASTPLETRAGYNYVINVRVNKTAIQVTASVVDWTDVTAEVVYPKIKIDVDYGVPGTPVRVNTFSFYRSLLLNDGYSEGETYKINNYYRRAAELTRSGSGSSETWTMTPQRYWSNHNQHYQFRLVWPNTTTAKKIAKDSEEQDPDWIEYVQKWRPHVEDKEYDDVNYQVIEIWNDPFQDVDPGKTDISNDDPIYHPYPSNLAIARPDVAENAECTNNEPGHTRTNLYNGGICATEGAIDLKFRFVMSQVEVRLTTTSSASAVRLEDAKIELVNAYTHGYVKLGDRTVEPDGDKTTDELDAWKTETVEGVATHFFRSAIVPQELDYTEPQASTNLRFKVTITNTDGTKDVYYADVAPILKAGTTKDDEYEDSDYVATRNKEGKWYWESGVHYIYNLNVSKTAIKATATLATWTEVEAAEEVWF